jgi:hypothetical protein
VEVTDGSGAVCSIDSALRRTLLSLLAIHAGQVMTADWLLEHVGWRTARIGIARCVSTSPGCEKSYATGT